MLILSGANIIMQNKDGLTALQCAYNQEQCDAYHKAIQCLDEQNEMLGEDIQSKSIHKKRKQNIVSPICKKTKLNI